MFDSLPSDATGILDWSWDQYDSYFKDLADRSLTKNEAALFLEDWTQVSELVNEVGSRLSVACDRNTADMVAKERYNQFLEDIYPKTEEAVQQLKEKLLSLNPTIPGFEIPMLKIRTEADLFREENLPLFVKEEKLCKQYDEIIGNQTVDWEGEETTISQLRPIFLNPDRTKREEAWKLGTNRQLQDRLNLNDLWKQLLKLRLKTSSNAGHGNYVDFRWKELLRFDYVPADCKLFHSAIEEVIVPAAQHLCDGRRKKLGIDTLRPWDLDVDPLGREPLAPYADTTELQSTCERIFQNVDTQLGSYFHIMLDEQLLDLENRKNKSPGGYCTGFPAAKRPFILMNAVGVHDDVQTLLHESGHAFHRFESNHLPYHQQRGVGMEFAEVASMAMELLASPYLAKDKGGFYQQSDADRALSDHLEKCILFWPYMALVDSFQHWVYENPNEAIDSSKCDEQWANLTQRFLPWLDWSDLENELSTGWHRKLHIFTVPLYYVEYGLAQLGSVQIWGNALKDQAAAVAAYRKALALGGTVPIPELFSIAGAHFACDSETLRIAVSLIINNLESMKKGLTD